jgi:endonuclease
VRLIIARCSVDYMGRLTAHLPLATRLIMIKADGAVLIHADSGTKALNWMPPGSRVTIAPVQESDDFDRGSYEPLNWMSPPCRLTEEPGRWSVTNKAGETLAITITEVISDTSVDLGVDPGLVKDGVEAHLQELLATQLELLGDGWRLVRREYPTPIGPVDLMCRDDAGRSVAVEIKRRGEIDGVEQLTRYLELLNRDPLLAPVQGVFAAQEIRPQARVLAVDRGIRCVTLDYNRMRGMEPEDTLF